MKLTLKPESAAKLAALTQALKAVGVNPYEVAELLLAQNIVAEVNDPDGVWAQDASDEPNETGTNVPTLPDYVDSFTDLSACEMREGLHEEVVAAAAHIDGFAE